MRDADEVRAWWSMTKQMQKIDNVDMITQLARGVGVVEVMVVAEVAAVVV